MARAKRTDRADARRRYRATQSEATATSPDASESPAAAPKASAPSTGQPASGKKTTAAQPDRPTLPPGQRPSFTASFRAAARPFDLRSDLAYVPTLVTRLPDARAVWIPAAAAVGSGAFFLLVQPLGSNGIANLLFQLFVLPPTIAGAFIAGILAPRATYIAGGIAALVGAIVFAVAVAITPVNLSTATAPAASPSPAPTASAAASAGPSDSVAPSASAGSSASPSASPTSGSSTTTDFDKVGAITQSILLSVPFGIAIGGFGGYYRRFLYLSNPSRQRREMEKQRQKQRQQSTKRRF